MELTDFPSYIRRIPKFELFSLVCVWILSLVCVCEPLFAIWLAYFDIIAILIGPFLCVCVNRGLGNNTIQ